MLLLLGLVLWRVAHSLPSCSPGRGARVVFDTLNPKRSIALNRWLEECSRVSEGHWIFVLPGYSANRRLRRVDFPQPEGPLITTGRNWAIRQETISHDFRSRPCSHELRVWWCTNGLSWRGMYACARGQGSDIRTSVGSHSGHEAVRKNKRSVRR